VIDLQEVIKMEDLKTDPLLLQQQRLLLEMFDLPQEA
jgi:hypothetical protein